VRGTVPDFAVLAIALNGQSFYAKSGTVPFALSWFSIGLQAHPAVQANLIRYDRKIERRPGCIRPAAANVRIAAVYGTTVMLIGTASFPPLLSRLNDDA